MSARNAAYRMPHYRRSTAEIDLRRLEGNFRAFQKLSADGTFICPMVKANAYGHGDIEVTKALRNAGSKHVGVALVEEGETLRRAGDRDSILVFSGFDEGSAEAALRESLTPVVNAWEHLASIASAASRLGASEIKLHFEFNTGMNRLGFMPSDAPKLREWLKDHREFRLEGICTHLLRGDDAGVPGGRTESQLEKFAVALGSFGDIKGLAVHTLNSSGAINLWKRILDERELGGGTGFPMGSRPGIGLYGIDPGNEENATIGLRPVMSVKSHVIAIQKVAKGEVVSYGPVWTAERDSTIGVIPFGYADGYRRAFTNKSSVLVRGQKVPSVGTICMDYFMIDLTDVEVASNRPAAIGDEVVLLGEQGKVAVTAYELAGFANSIAYEILTGISDRVPRVFIRA